MLQELSIRNFAIIDDINISLSEGLTVLSGETGAGKSIIINAVNLLLGSRATSKLIRTGAENAELEAMFHILPGSFVYKIMENHDYDPNEGLLIRRIISGNDRHRIYINGRIGTIQLLTSITENITSISGQHAHQGLLKEEQHLLIIDQFGGLIPQREVIKKYYHEILPLTKKLNELKNLKTRQKEHIDLLEFQKKEIEEASVYPDEDTVLEKERIILKNSDRLYNIAHSGVQELYSNQGAVVEKLVDIKKEFEKAGQLDFELVSRAEELQDVIYKIEEISNEVREYRNNIQIDDRRLEDVEIRLDKLQKLKRKYGKAKGSIADVLNYYETIKNDLASVKNLNDSIEEVESDLKNIYEKIEKKSKELSESRGKVSIDFAEKVEHELSSLEMPNTVFKVFLSKTEAGSNTIKYLSADGYVINETGLDQAIFMISPNVGEKLKPLSQIASGGELSRVVLALKAILAKVDSIETIVFDEVDAGIGGGVAEIVGKKIASLSRFHQVICITHLAQIAKFANHHFKIIKNISNGRTNTSIRILNQDERLGEIARMLGGIEITKATLDHAKELLNNS